MTDFNIMNKGLKVTWIPRINSENEASWKIIPKVTLKKTKENISTKNVYSILLKKIFQPPTAKNMILRYNFSHETIHKVYESKMTLLSIMTL